MSHTTIDDLETLLGHAVQGSPEKRQYLIDAADRVRRAIANSERQQVLIKSAASVVRMIPRYADSPETVRDLTSGAGELLDSLIKPEPTDAT